MYTERKYHPPRLALKIFRWYCRPDRLEELEGDLAEFYHLRLADKGLKWKADLFYWWNVIRCYKTYAKSKTQKHSIMIPLFKSYFKLAMRHSWKNKWAVLVNVIGLGIALSMCIFVYSIYAYNFEFDDFYKNTDDVYRINAMTFENGQERRNEISPFPFESILRNEVAGVQQVSSYFSGRMGVKQGSDYFSEYVGVVSSDFFNMFDIPLWYGSKVDISDQPIVYLTQSAAKRLFGNKVALGESFTLYVSNDDRLEVTVGGVFERIPLNTSFDMDILISLDNYCRATDRDLNDWTRLRYTSHFIRASTGQLNQIEKALGKYVPQQNEGHESMKMNRFELVPFQSSIHNNDEMYRNNSNIRLGSDVLIIFTVLTVMVFLIACFNLANTSMAMISKRLKEIGVRKTLGSENRQILMQFLLEMGIVCLLSFIVAVSMVDLTSSSIMGLFGETFLVRDISLSGVILFILSFLVITTLVAGLMPALYAWRFQPVAIMRKSVKLKGVNWLNKSLTVAQFSFSIAVLSAAISFSNNSSFLDELNPGYENDNVYVLDLGESKYFNEMKQEVEQLAGVETVGTPNHVANFGRYSRTRILGIDTTRVELRTYSVGDGYLDFMDIPIAQGRSFIEGSELDQQSSIIVNQVFADRYFEGDAVTKVVTIDSVRKTIVGVFPNLIQDVYSDSEDRPIAFLLDSASQFRFLISKINHGEKDEFVSSVKEIWSQNIDLPFDGEWQKDMAYGSAVRDTENLRIIFLGMAILGGFLSIVGVFSLAKLNVAKRIKEISIRKVLGASIRELLLTVNKSFTIILLIALATGGVLGYFVADTVLGMIYKFHAETSIMTSLLSGIFIILISAIMITSVTMVPANSNPVS